MNNRKNVTLALLLLGVMLLLAAALWFALSPSMAKKKMLARQDELLDSITQGDGTIAVDINLADVTLDFYDSGADEPPEIDIAAILNETVTEETPLVTVFDSAGHVETAPEDSGVITGIGILTIERIEARLPVTDGVSEAQLKVAVGHVPETAPVGGDGNAIIAGHRSYTYGHYFNRLGELETGDIIKYQPKDGEEMAFEVFEILTVLPDDPAVYADFPGEQILTLHTCTPVRVASHRLLVRARRIY